ncbi:hypothetical protein CDL15_Pgr016580 [Punica granatum]|uniref:Uncharacterized protein n=1 Tax=Punica granatum TaxID=22663 RepID=A0A218XSK1_PUNGR|nr:hypothetical protein CDL15_Pgr016580 [Punica granatum]
MTDSGVQGQLSRVNCWHRFSLAKARSRQQKPLMGRSPESFQEDVINFRCAVQQSMTVKNCTEARHSVYIN